MKITIINNRPAGGNAVYCVDGTSVSPGYSHSMSNRTTGEAIQALALIDANLVIVRLEVEGDDKPPIVCTMKNPGDPVIDALYMAGVGFDLLTLAGAAANEDPAMYFGVYDDAACIVPSTTANLNTATTGTIVSGTGTNLIAVTPSAAGVFVCRVTIPAAANKTVYLKAWIKSTEMLVDSLSSDTVAFTKT